MKRWDGHVGAGEQRQAQFGKHVYRKRLALHKGFSKQSPWGPRQTWPDCSAPRVSKDLHTPRAVTQRAQSQGLIYTRHVWDEEVERSMKASQRLFDIQPQSQYPPLFLRFCVTPKATSWGGLPFPPFSTTNTRERLSPHLASRCQ